MESIQRALKLTELNEYVLIEIFQYCSQTDLESLYIASIRLRDIISNLFSKLCVDILMTGTHENSKNNPRTFTELSEFDRLRMTRNWNMGNCSKKLLHKCIRVEPPKMFLDHSTFYWSFEGEIQAHERSEMEIVEQKDWMQISSRQKSVICDFTKKGNTIFAGRKNGSCFIYDGDNITERQIHKNDESIRIVDFYENVFVSSTEKTTKLWLKYIDENSEPNLMLIENFKCPFNCLKISESGDYMIVSEIKGVAYEIDIDTLTSIELKCSSNTWILDFIYKDDTSIITTNYDKTLRLYDKRSGSFEIKWNTYNMATCLEYDGMYGVLCGFKNQGSIKLFDIRKSSKDAALFAFRSPLTRTEEFMRSKFINPYSRYINQTLEICDRITGITCDCRYLFAATNVGLRVCDFKRS